MVHDRLKNRRDYSVLLARLEGFTSPCYLKLIIGFYLEEKIDKFKIAKDRYQPQGVIKTKFIVHK